MKNSKIPLRGEGAGETIIGLAFWGLIIWGGFAFFGDKSTNSSSTSSYSNSSYSDYSPTQDEREPVSEPENPYDDGTGHSAGYEWAQENDPSYCDGNSNSFNEGCQEYLDQQDQYQSDIDEQDSYQ